MSGDTSEADEQRAVEMLDDIRTLLRSGDVRIELGYSFSLTGAHPTARLYRRRVNRWARVDPLLLPPDGGTHADLLDTLAGLIREEPGIELDESSEENP